MHTVLIADDEQITRVGNGEGYREIYLYDPRTAKGVILLRVHLFTTSKSFVG